MFQLILLLANRKELGSEVDEYNIKILQNVPHLWTTTDVWSAESDEGFCLFTMSYINSEWEFKAHTLICSILNRRQTGKELADVFSTTMRRFKIDWKVSFTTTDGANSAKRKIALTAEKKTSSCISMNSPVNKNLHNLRMTLKTQTLTTYFVNWNWVTTYSIHQQTVVC